MMNIIPSNKRHYADHGWLKTNWHFSFSDYYDPNNMNWSVLRVFNDDVVAPASGFGMHPHRDMEIITYVIDGQLTHKDSVGHEGTVSPGEVQVMSAGTGLFHSEYNHSTEKAVHLLQLWVLPRHKGFKPRWEQKQFTTDQRRGRLLPVVTDIDRIESNQADNVKPLGIDQDTTIYVAELASGERVAHDSEPNRQAYLFVIAGAVTVNGQVLQQGDQARIVDEPSLQISAKEDAHLILLDLP